MILRTLFNKVLGDDFADPLVRSAVLKRTADFLEKAAAAAIIAAFIQESFVVFLVGCLAAVTCFKLTVQQVREK